MPCPLLGNTRCLTEQHRCLGSSKGSEFLCQLVDYICGAACRSSMRTRRPRMHFSLEARCTATIRSASHRACPWRRVAIRVTTTSLAGGRFVVHGMRTLVLYHRAPILRRARIYAGMLLSGSHQSLRSLSVKLQQPYRHLPGVLRRRLRHLRSRRGAFVWTSRQAARLHTFAVFIWIAYREQDVSKHSVLWKQERVTLTLSTTVRNSHPQCNRTSHTS